MEDNTLTFFDYETVSLLDIKQVGADRYLSHPYTTWLMVAYWDDTLQRARYDVNPAITQYLQDGDLNALRDNMHDGACDFLPDGDLAVAWNARFDRLVAEYNDAEGLPIERTLDAMALALSCNLPGRLDQAARAINLKGKLGTGQKLIRDTHTAWADIWNQDKEGRLEREERGRHALQRLLSQMGAYAIQDIVAMVGVWNSCVPWQWLAWREYWASERVNDRGLPIDRALAEACAGFREEETAWANARLADLTGDAVSSVYQSGAINHYIADTGTEEELAELTEAGTKSGLSLGKPKIERMLYLNGLDEAEPDYMPLADGHRELLEHLQYARSTASAKFAKMVEEAGEDDRVRGAFRWNGAGQTGRFSSQGAQMHNLIRASWPDQLHELGVIDFALSGVPLADLVEMAGLETDAPAPVLSRLLRPTILAPEGRCLVWGDWSQIEFVLNAWLSGSRKAEELVLAPYRQGDDLYRLQAARSLRKGLEDVTDDERQGYKVACLSLIFRGGAGAYAGMAAGYGMHPTKTEAQTIVENWRGANGWSGVFADQVDAAVQRAKLAPGQAFTAGRVTYLFNPDLMGGTLLCQLPSMRVLVYPEFRLETWTVVDKKTGKEEQRRGYRCLHRGGRRALWTGIFVENVTQAAAADVLRHCLVELEDAGEAVGAVTIGHTHDEILLEIDDTEHARAGTPVWLQKIMESEGLPAWAKDIGLRAECQVGEWYTKAPRPREEPGAAA